MIIRFVIALVLIFNLGLTGVFAQTDEFTIGTQVGADTTAPTIPAPFSATPVATTQIDLAWGSSTDNVLLSGYRVYRDNIQIATTTSLAYSDVGLSASTTYSYYVTAYDSSNNESASSTEIATTTLPIVVSSTTDPVSRGGERVELEVPPIELVRLEVIPATTSVVIRYETPGFVKAVVKWGETPGYELGSIAERAFSKTHETTIRGLRPDTLHYFTIEGENRIGDFGVLTSDTFKTLAEVDTMPPANVSNLRARKIGSDIELTWDNPADSDFDRVRIMSSPNFYPSDSLDGLFSYEGDSERFLDRGAAKPGTTKYYTVFTYDERGNISSGAVVALSIDEKGVVGPPEIVIDETLNPMELEFNDLIFIQDGRALPKNEDGVEIDGGKQFTISIAANTLPERLKTILVTLTSSSNASETFSFLLRIDAEKAYYTADIAPLGIAGSFPLRVSVFDFKTAQIGYTDGTITSKIMYRASERANESFFGYLANLIKSPGNGYLLLFILILVLLALVAVSLMKKRQTHTQTQES